MRHQVGQGATKYALVAMHQVVVPQSQRMQELLAGLGGHAQRLPGIAPRIHRHGQVTVLLLGLEVVEEGGDRSGVVA